MLLFGPGTDRDWLTVHVMEHSHVNDKHLIRVWWLGPRVWHNGYVLALNWPWAGSQACDVDGESVGPVQDRFYMAVEDTVRWVEAREQ